MIGAVFVYNHKGEIIISRMYRNDFKRSLADLFRIQVISNPQITSPINSFPYTSYQPNGTPIQTQVNFFHIRNENLYIVACAKDTMLTLNVASLFTFLHKFVKICKDYFGNKFDEDAVKNNFVLIYELLDEIMDFGYPQISDVDSLKLYITTEGVKSEKTLKEESSKITIQTTGATSWRRQDIKYRNNEVYLDVVESVNVLMSAKNTILKSDVVGQVMMRAYLSGMPECKLGLNDKVVLQKQGGPEHVSRKAPTNAQGSIRNQTQGVALDDIQFHQCVKLGRFDQDRTISFVPQDGEFELMRYRTTDNINLPFKVQAIVNEQKSKVEYKIAVKSLFNASLFATGVVIKIPTPPNSAKATISVPIGKAKYQSGENCLQWKISKFGGEEEYTLTAEVEVSASTYSTAAQQAAASSLQASSSSKKPGQSGVVAGGWTRPPITMDFQVMMFTGSGLTVQFLKVFEKSNYKSVKWVRYYTKAGSYQFRF
ncbi:hypothetical protein MP228_006296 [Amoeboaphelidium protococcarum]|nr:hypothetical protein MP228_006296 [Amoeboaphelidium protococcarum]